MSELFNLIVKRHDFSYFAEGPSQKTNVGLVVEVYFAARFIDAKRFAASAK